MYRLPCLPLRLFCLCLLTGASFVQAATLQVTTTVDGMNAADQQCSLREAIHNANTNTRFSQNVNECPAGSASETDVIVLAGGNEYLLTLSGDGANQGDLDLEQNHSAALDLRIHTPGQMPATVRQTIAGQRVFDIHGINVAIENVIIRGGSADVGGGIRNSNGDLRLQRVHVIQNHATSGGGVHHAGGGLEVVNSELQLNTASSSGGAITLQSGTMIVRDSLLRGNSAATGGAIAQSGGSTQLVNAVLDLNQATTQSGGALVKTGGTLIISQSRFESNSSQSVGGAMSGGAGGTYIRHSQFIDNTSMNGGGAISGGTVHMDASILVGNSAAVTGGAISANFLFVKNSTIQSNTSAQGGGGVRVGNYAVLDGVRIVGNSAASQGGGLYLGGGGLEASHIRNSEISDNHASMGGGVYFSDGAPTHIANTTITNNAANEGGGMYIKEGASVIAVHLTLLGHVSGQDLYKYGDLTLGNSIISTPGQPDCVMSLNNPTIVSLGHNLAEDASCFGLNQPGDQIATDPMAESLDFHGGATRSYSLQANSPALDSASYALCQATPVSGLDQRGGIRQIGGSCDVGAHEQMAQIDRIFIDGLEAH